jgi:hypothetical protein
VRVITMGATLLVLARAQAAVAAPAADLVVVWAPGARIAPVEQVAHAHGAAVIDRSPHPTATAQTAEKLRAAISTYNTLAFQQAKDQLDAVRSEIDANGAAGLSPAQLSDLFIYRGLARGQLGDESGSFDDLVIAAGIDPTRSLDPQVFTPKQIDEFARAKEAVAQRPHGKVTLDVPAGCTATLDAAPATAPVDRAAGYHWVRVACPDREPRGQPVLLTGGDITVPIQPAPYLPPSDSDLLVQARTAGSRAVIVVEVHGNVGTARLVGLDGRERDRRTVSLGSDLGPLADAVGDLLAPPPEHHWYQSKWTWAAGGVAAAAIILVPLTAAIAGSNGDSTFHARPTFPGGGPWQ